MKRILGTVQPRMVLAPQGTAAAVAAGDWVNMADYDSALFIFGCDDGAADDDFSVHIRQAQDNAATGAKDVVVRRFYRASAAALSVGTDFAAVAPATVEGLTNACFIEGDDFQVVTVEVTADELDVENGFHYVTAGFGAGGAAGKLISCFVLLSGARYAVEPPDFPDVS